MARPLEKVSREIFRPIWRHAVRRIEPRFAAIEERLGKIEPRLEAIEERLGKIAREDAVAAATNDSLAVHLPAFLNAVRSVRAFGFELSNMRREVAVLADGNSALAKVGERLDGLMAELGNKADCAALDGRLDGLTVEIGRKADAAALGERLDRLTTELGGKVDAAAVPQIWERVEFIRREIMYELMYRTGARAPVQDKQASKRESAPTITGDDIRLNLGCGHIPVVGYLNVDMRRLPGVDVVAPVDALPADPGTVQEIFSSHLLEHFPQEQLRRQLLPYWFSLLKPGGRFRAIMPDGDEMIRRAGVGTYGFDDFREVLFGAQEYEGDFHFNLLTPESAAELLSEAGFGDIAIPVRGRRNGKCFEFEIVAARPAQAAAATEAA